MDTSIPPTHPASGLSPSPPPPKRAMSRGTKWAIGIVAVVLLLSCVACLGVSMLFAPVDRSVIPSGDSVALIHLEGVIAGTGSLYDGVVSPEGFLDELDQALKDPDVKAILLRIDSPGGTVAASQEIALAVRRASEEKPVVASIGDIGASGAYMVASQCDRIVASPGSSVGSIGVIMEIPNVAGLLDKLGVEFTVLTQGELKDVGSPYRSVTPTETALLNEQMRLAYEQFIADVAEGRGMDEAEVRKLATGWVWLGSEAIELGLVDEIGNFDDAVDVAAELGGIEGEPQVVSYEPEYRLQDLIYDLLGLRSRLGAADVDALRRLGLPK